MRVMLMLCQLMMLMPARYIYAAYGDIITCRFSPYIISPLRRHDAADFRYALAMPLMPPCHSLYISLRYIFRRYLMLRRFALPASSAPYALFAALPRRFRC